MNRSTIIRFLQVFCLLQLVFLSVWFVGTLNAAPVPEDAVVQPVAPQPKPSPTPPAPPALPKGTISPPAETDNLAGAYYSALGKATETVLSIRSIFVEFINGTSRYMMGGLIAAGLLFMTIGIFRLEKLYIMLFFVLGTCVSLPFVTEFLDYINENPKIISESLAARDAGLPSYNVNVLHIAIENQKNWNTDEDTPFFIAMGIGAIGSFIGLFFLRFAFMAAGGVIGFFATKFGQLLVETDHEEYLKYATFVPVLGAMVGSCIFAKVRRGAVSWVFCLAGSILFAAGIDLVEIEGYEEFYPTGFGDFFICLQRRSELCKNRVFPVTIYIIPSILMVVLTSLALTKRTSNNNK